MEILSPQQLREADQITIKNQGISSWELMERAALNTANKLIEIIPVSQNIQILAGSGNNGGDGLAIAYHLQKKAYHIEVLLIEYSPNLSQDNKINLKRLESDNLVKIYRITSNSSLSNFKPNSVIIDAIFGIGLNRVLPKFVQNLIKKANQSAVMRISIDVPSGLFLDSLTPKSSTVFQAHYTLTFQCPKLNFFLPDYGNSLGEIVVIDIGLDQNYTSTQKSPYKFVDKNYISSFLKIRKRFSHKGDYGHLLMIGGQYGMMGSLCLATKASLRSGVGKISVLTPKCGVEILQEAIPEAIVISSESQKYVSPVQLNFIPTSICIGMGIGDFHEALETLKFAVKSAKSPMVIDADGLNLLSKNKWLLKLLPPKTVLTPHQGELKRLIGDWSDEYDKLDKMKEFVQCYNLILVSKDAYTFIVDKHNIYINSTGNAGMATAGSGDTLSGIISGLMVQKYTPLEACLLGVYWHGKAADNYAQKFEKSTLIASDIIDLMRTKLL